MINELQKQYEKEVARLKGAVEGFVKSEKKISIFRKIN